MCTCESAKVLVVRGSPVHYLLVRANHYAGRVQIVGNVDDALRHLLSDVSGRHDGDDDDVVLLTDAAVADNIASHVREFTDKLKLFVCTSWTKRCTTLLIPVPFIINEWSGSYVIC